MEGTASTSRCKPRVRNPTPPTTGLRFTSAITRLASSAAYDDFHVDRRTDPAACSRPWRGRFGRRLTNRACPEGDRAGSARRSIGRRRLDQLVPLGQIDRADFDYAITYTKNGGSGMNPTRCEVNASQNEALAYGTFTGPASANGNNIALYVVGAHGELLGSTDQNNTDVSAGADWTLQAHLLQRVRPADRLLCEQQLVSRKVEAP